MDYRNHPLFPEMCRVIGQVVLEIHEFGLAPKSLVIAGMLRTTLAGKQHQLAPETRAAMEMAITLMAPPPDEAP
ncbi:DUF2767 family protein [Shimwellia blattae]|nr:DUF2767 family protein [Shimwellia blattae]GAB80774.1 hypothetical protein YdhZ [Shimwellia blattae DSM 4481 = NBRC 105725]VDY64598.1 Protein of uncharacterised function (DUF2767) [Shimwellia blattae]VEC22706.1 Protein of uncharacterised function (DUF2767) [Shimwellia blattae]